MNEPLVSAIVSTYNSEKFIRGKIDDLLNQTISDKVEIIIINSGSLQNENSIIREYLSKYSNIKYIKTEKRETIYQAWNKAIKISSGKFITNSNTDDRLRNDAFEVLTKSLIDYPEVGMVYADQYISSLDNQLFSEGKKLKPYYFPDYDIKYQLERCIVGSQPMWRASLHFKDNIWFGEDFEVSGDHEFELKISHKYKIYHIKDMLGLYYKSKEGKNKEYEDASRNLKEVRKIQRIHIPIYLNNVDKKELDKLRKYYGKYLKIPLPILFLIKMFQGLRKYHYPKYFFHSSSYIYYFNILLMRKMNEDKRSKQIAKRFLRYRNSELILNAFNLNIKND